MKPDHITATEYARGLMEVFDHTAGADMVANLAAAYLALGEVRDLAEDLHNARAESAQYRAWSDEYRVARDEARDRCASLEAALRECVALGADSRTGPGSLQWSAHVARIDALLGPSPEGSPEDDARAMWEARAKKTIANMKAMLDAAEVDETPTSPLTEDDVLLLLDDGEPPEGTGLHFPEATPAEMSAAMTSLLGEPPEGTETRKAASPTRRRQRAERAEAKKRMRSAPSPLHGETEDEARERRERWERWAEARSARSTPDPDDWRTHPELRDLLAKIPDDSDRTRAFRLLNEALECKATPPQGAQMESETSIAPPVSLPDDYRVLKESDRHVILEHVSDGWSVEADADEDSGDYVVSDAASPEAMLWVIRRVWPGLLPGATLTEDQRRDPDEPEWVVNDIGELGVRVGGRFFFMYKGRSLEYVDPTHTDEGPSMGKPMRWRYVYKREFGEVCRPAGFWDEHGRCRYPDLYTFGNEEDWHPLPALSTLGGDE